jgi:hypothetical protein
MNAAIGWTIRMEERVCRELKGRLKSLLVPASLKRLSTGRSVFRKDFALCSMYL